MTFMQGLPFIDLNPSSLFDPVGDEIIKTNPWNRLIDNYDADPDFTPAAEEESTVKSSKRDTTIKDRAVQLLCFVSHYEDVDLKCEVDSDYPAAGSVGLSYADILDKIKDEFPDCGTNISCLRWYAVQIRNRQKGYGDRTLPRRRPRS